MAKLSKSSRVRKQEPHAPGRSHREGISVTEMASMFATEAKATEWFETWLWPGGEMSCLLCGSVDAYRVKSGKPMPYRCRDCKRYFSIKSATALKDSKLPLRKWAWAIYLEMTSLKGVSSMKLHRDLGVTQKTAWFMLHRIREAFADLLQEADMEGPVEVDETYVGGKRRNMPKSKRKELTGRGPVGKTAVIGMKDRKTNRVVVKVIDDKSAASLHAFVNAHRRKGAKVYTDDAKGYKGLDNHESVNHSVGEYVREMAHTNGIESFWSMLKRGYTGVYHRMSVDHLERYAVQFAGRHNVRDMDTLDQMGHVLAGLVGRRLMYKELVS